MTASSAPSIRATRRRQTSRRSGSRRPSATSRSTAAAATAATPRRATVGRALEGPYISAGDGPRGAHPRDHVRPPDWDEFRRLQDAAGGLIRILTLAPELPGALPFIEQLVGSGVVVALGHTAASG